jgi:hypothetical protein
MSVHTTRDKLNKAGMHQPNTIDEHRQCGWKCEWNTPQPQLTIHKSTALCMKVEILE